MKLKRSFLFILKLIFFKFNNVFLYSLKFFGLIQKLYPKVGLFFDALISFIPYPGNSLPIVP